MVPVSYGVRTAAEGWFSAIKKRDARQTASQNGRNVVKRTTGYFLAAACAATLVAGMAQGASAADKKYTIYLSNNFVGNDWRQQMERVATVSANKGPLAGRVDLKIENVENTVQAQLNSLNNIIPP